MISINTNVGSMNAQRNLSKSGAALNTSFERLSSGLRINRAGDDAAGLAISEDMKAQIRSMGQAERNSNDGISLLQTAEGSLSEVGGILGRMRELATQSASGTLDATQRGYVDEEFQALATEIDRISAVTEFNGTALLDGTANVDLQVGINNTANDRINVTIAAMDTAGLGIGASDVTTAGTAQTAIDSLDAAIEIVSGQRANIGSTENRLQVTVSNLASARENLSASNSRIRDVDVASETAALTRNNILQQAGVSILAQANQAPQLALSLL
ncbi:MAG: flagellin [Polyangiales bacterium]|jgi:flagellin